MEELPKNHYDRKVKAELLIPCAAMLLVFFKNPFTDSSTRAFASGKSFLIPFCYQEVSDRSLPSGYKITELDGATGPSTEPNLKQ